MTGISGKVAIVTGGAKGIGRGTAIALAKRGARLVLVDMDTDALDQAAGMIGELGREALPIAIDIGREDAFDVIRERTLARFGTVDILMNNVGIIVSGLPEDVPLAEWQLILDLNVMAVARSLHRFIPDLLAKGEGHIVNTASFAGLYPYAIDRIPYATSKGAVVSMTESLALYLMPRGIGVTLLCPGPVRTGISKTRRNFTEGLPLRGPGAQFGFKEPEAVGEMVADAIEANRFFLPTDEGVNALLAERAAGLDAFIARTVKEMSADVYAG